MSDGHGNGYVSPPEDIYDAVSEMSESETRTIRNMVIVLLREALVTRKNGRKL